MVSAAEQLTRDDDGDGTTDVYGLGVDPEVIRIAPFVWSNGGTLVDDEASARSTLALLLRKRNHRVTEADRGAVAKSGEAQVSVAHAATFVARGEQTVTGRCRVRQRPVTVSRGRATSPRRA